MKLFHKIAITTLGIAMATAVGAGIARYNRSDVKMAKAATVTAYTLDGTIITSETGDSSYDTVSTVVQDELSWSVTGNTTMNPWRIGGKGAKNNVTNTFDRAVYSNAPVSSENIDTVTFTAGTISASNFTINSFTLIVSTAENGGGTVISSLTGTITASDDTVFERPNAADWSNKYFKLNFNVSCSGTKSDAKNVFLQFVSLNFTFEKELVTPDTIEISGESSASIGETVQLSATATKSGSSTNVNQNVVWSSLSEDKATVSATGLVTALSNGQATIKAASEDDATISGTYIITISGVSSCEEPLTFTTSKFGMTSSSYNYNGIRAANGLAFSVNQVAQCTTDYKPEEVILTYEKGAIIFQKNGGYLKTQTAVSHNIKKVIISAVNENEPALTISGDTTSRDGAFASTPAVTHVGRMYTYTFSTSVKYLNLVNSSNGAVYINSFTLEFDGCSETVNSLADFILGIMPDRVDNTGLCLGENGNYEIAKARFLAADPNVQSTFQTSEDEIVVAARTRYLQWADAYGDGTPFANSLSSRTTRTIINNTNTVLVVSVLSVIGLLSTAGVFFMLRKRKHQ